MEKISGDEMYTPVEQALDELRRRRQDHDLVARVTAFLDGDIPEYLKQHDCFVLPRHIATPNNEALYVLDRAQQVGARAVFSQDPKDRFTSVNSLKRRLALPEICEETADGRSYSKLEIVDAVKAEGLRLKDVRCRDGDRLVDFHNSLFESLDVSDFLIVDDSAWVDRNHRGDLTKHYQNHFSLFVALGVLFEDFDTDQSDFFQQVVRPAFLTVWRTFGIPPIIVRPYPVGCPPDERFDLAYRTEIIAGSTKSLHLNQ